MMGSRKEAIAVLKAILKYIFMMPAGVAAWILKQYLAVDEEKFYNGVMRRLMCQLEQGSRYYLSYNLRPKHAEQIVCIETDRAKYSDTAVLIQGPIVAEEEFTYETVKLYRRIFPGARLIISAWEEDKIFQDKFEREGCLCVFSKKPDEAGFGNVNLQVCSVLKGLRAAQNSGVRYALKTRSDMRIYQIGAIDFLKNQIKQYPPENGDFAMHGRIVAADFRCLGTMFWPYFIGDQWSFGYLDDMMDYWSMETAGKHWACSVEEVQNKTIGGRHVFSKKERVERGFLTEGNIVLDFLRRKTGRDYEVSIKEYWDVLQKYFIIVDRRILNFYWRKYDMRYEENLHNGSYRRDDSVDSLFSYTWNYLSWVNLYHGSMDYEAVYEQYAEERKY